MSQTPCTTTILQWLKNNPLVFQWKQENDLFILKEWASLKTFSFSIQNITDHRLTPHPQGLSAYLNLMFDDGSQVVLCHAGVAFAPDFQNTGILDDAPQVVCMMDYYQMYNHMIDLAQDESQSTQTLHLFEILISVLDGAKKIGLDVSSEESQLDSQLSEFEKNYG